MTLALFLSILAIALPSTWTPGPNNAMLASSGATFGLRRTVPHALGVALGFPLMLFLVGLFLGELFQRSAVLQQVLRCGGAALLLWVAWKIATSGGLGGKGARARPLRFHEAVAFQWINPKAWVMAIGISAQFIGVDAPMRSALGLAAVFVLSGLSSAFGWASAGAVLARFLATPARLRIFNVTMSGLIVLGVVWMLRV